MKSLYLVLFCFIFSFDSNSGQSDFFDKKIILNLKNVPVADFLKIIAKQNKMELFSVPGIYGNIQDNFKDITSRSALDEIGKKHNFTYTIKNNILFIYKLNANLTTSHKERIPQSINSEQNTSTELPSHNLLSSDTTPIDHANNKQEDGKDTFEFIPIKFLEAKTLIPMIRPLVHVNDQTIADEQTNSITFIGTRKSLNTVKDFLKTVDIAPAQIVIEAQIIEMTKNKSREFGVSLGDITNSKLDLPKGGNGSGVSLPSRSLAPNLSLGIKMGSVAGNILQARIDAAEQSGEAKVISRPKVATLNNISAMINSGISYNVKTASQGSGGTVVAGSIQTIKAGLNLTVTPSVFGENQIKLKITLTNSEPNNSTAIDGIPSINENTANATVVIGNGETAVMAGLIKQSNGTTRNGVPGLSSIPILGWLFKSQLEKSESTELMILITPKIVPATLPSIGEAQMSEALDINRNKFKE